MANGFNPNKFLPLGRVVATPPKVVVKEDTETTYILTITWQAWDGTMNSFDTPNLRGQTGATGGFFAFDIINGDLWMFYQDADSIPSFSIDDATGDLIVTFQA
jgi:hypothetical protein